MKGIILVITVAFALIYSSCSNPSSTTEDYNYGVGEGGVVKKKKFHRDTTIMEAGNFYYQCPNHPKIVSHDPGPCPKCGSEMEMHEKQ